MAWPLPYSLFSLYESLNRKKKLVIRNQHLPSKTPRTQRSKPLPKTPLLKKSKVSNGKQTYDPSTIYVSNLKINHPQTPLRTTPRKRTKPSTSHCPFLVFCICLFDFFKNTLSRKRFLTTQKITLDTGLYTFCQELSTALSTGHPTRFPHREQKVRPIKSRPPQTCPRRKHILRPSRAVIGTAHDSHRASHTSLPKHFRPLHAPQQSSGSLPERPQPSDHHPNSGWHIGCTGDSSSPGERA